MPTATIIITIGNNTEEGFDLLLSHFEPPYWPRRVSTKTTQGKQILVHDKEEALARFKQANFMDCRINAYNPLYVEYSGTNRQAPDFIFIDIDKASFMTQKAYDLACAKTLKNFKEKLPGSCPTILDTGNGCHFYQPISAPFVLETRGDVFTKLNSEPSKAFLKFAEQFLSDGKADHSHNPTFRSCMLRIPGSINSGVDTYWHSTSTSASTGSNNTTNTAQVKIMQKWDGQRPAINYLLRDFRQYLIQNKIDQHYQKESRNASRRPNRSGCAAGTNTTIRWIESNILQGEGISDCRKITIDLVLAPYLINIKKYDYNTAYDTILKWLDKCAGKRPLTFNANYKLRCALNRAQNGPVLYPMRLDTMKSKYPEMYREVFHYD